MRGGAGPRNVVVMNIMRFTVVDRSGAVSFVAPCNVMKALVGGCCAGPADIYELLIQTEKYEEKVSAHVLNGLAVFDEWNSPGRYTAIHTALEHLKPHETPVFRVVDDVTRQASLEPVKAGLIIFNLNERRIIQVQNSYSEIRRQDRGRVHDGGKPTGKMFQYRLPSAWALVP
jgi:hypothetical protein